MSSYTGGGLGLRCTKHTGTVYACALNADTADIMASALNADGITNAFSHALNADNSVTIDTNCTGWRIGAGESVTEPSVKPRLTLDAARREETLIISS